MKHYRQWLFTLCTLAAIAAGTRTVAAQEELLPPTPATDQQSPPAPSDPYQGKIDPSEIPKVEPPPPAEEEFLPSGARLVNFNQPGKIPGQYFVFFRKSSEVAALNSRRNALEGKISPEILPTTKQTTKELAAALAQEYGGKVQEIFEENLNRYPADQNGFMIEEISEESIKNLANDPRIDYVAPVLGIHTTAEQTLTGSNLYHLDQIDQHSLVGNGKYVYNYTGQGQTIYVLDTGIRSTHSAFAGRIKFPPWGSFVPTADFSNLPCTIGVSCISNIAHVVDCTRASALTDNKCFGVDPNAESYGDGASPEPYSYVDCDGHGTAVASLVNGPTNGVAKSAKVVGVIVLKSCNPADYYYDVYQGTDNDVARGLDWVMARSGRGIINLSIQVDGISAPVETRITQAINAGFVVVTGSGPWGNAAASSACDKTPSRMSAVITVGAVNGSGQNIANYGNCIDVFAPAQGIRAAGIGNDAAMLSVTGSSFAAPQVSGIAALYLQQYPLATPAQVHTAIVNGATNGILTGNLGCITPPSTGCSPNKLAYSLLTDAPVAPPSGGGGGPTPPYGGGDPPPNPAVSTLQSIWNFLFGD